MFCKNCGAPLGETSKFCLNCGAKVAEESPAPIVAPVPEKKKRTLSLGILIAIIILSVMLVGEAGFIVYDKMISTDYYSENDDDKLSNKKTSSDSSALGDGSSLPSSSENENPSSDASSETVVPSKPEVSDEFDSTDICGEWQLVSLTDEDGNELPQCYTFYSFKFYPDGTADVVYINGDFSRDSYSIEWTYDFGNYSGEHYYELADNKGNTYSLCFIPKNNEILMEYLLENDKSEFHYYARQN